MHILRTGLKLPDRGHKTKYLLAAAFRIIERETNLTDQSSASTMKCKFCTYVVFFFFKNGRL